MSESDINIPGCSEPLVLEPCEVVWLADPERSVFSDWRTDEHGVHVRCNAIPQHAAAVYECALRDAVLEHMRNRAVTVSIDFSDIPVVATEPEDGSSESYHYDAGPTPLHAWRTVAQHLKVGPWGTD